MWRDSERNPAFRIQQLNHAEWPPACVVATSGGVLSEVHGYDGHGGWLGDGQTGDAP